MTDADKATSDLVNKDKDSVDFSKVDKDYSALIGQKVKVLFKNGKTNDVIGVYATSDNIFDILKSIFFFIILKQL